MNTREIAIIADSTCDVPQPMLDEYGISIIPHIVIWGEEQYRDRVDIQPEEFYRRLEQDAIRPTSSQASVQDFAQTYQEAILRGAKQIVVLTVSSAMSGAYQMALNAARLVQVPVRVVDAKGPTMSLGWQALAAARARDAGATLDEIVAAVGKVRDRLVQFVCMDTLEYLQRGGRIGGAVKWVGTLLQIKPLVSINHRTGLVEPESMARTHKSVVEAMYQKFFDRLGQGSAMHVAVLHGNVPEEAGALAERIREEYSPDELLVNITGPVLGINTGPRALALCGYCE